MKKITLVVFFLSALVVAGFSLSSVAKSILTGERMDLAQAEKKWGEQAFSADKFRGGEISSRAAMAASIVKQKIFVGSSIEEVEQSLGRHDAYYKNDFIPAYALNEGWKTDEDTWQLVFLPGRDSKIIEVFIHKNCCKR